MSNPFASPAPPGTREHARAVGYAQGLNSASRQMPAEVNVNFRRDFEGCLIEGWLERARIEQEDEQRKMAGWRDWAERNYSRILAGFGREVA